MWASQPSTECSQQVLGTDSHSENSKERNYPIYPRSHDYIFILWGWGSSKIFTVPTENHPAGGPNYQQTNHLSSVAFPQGFQARQNKKFELFWRSTSFKVIEFGANREPVYNFLLMINSNLGPVSHHYWDTVTYWPKIANFAHPLSFSALIRGDPLRIYGNALQFLKLEFFRQPMVKIWWF